MTPLGTILAQALWSDGRVRLVSAAGERAYDSLDALAMDLLGETLPLNALLDWLRGQPWPKAASAPRGDGLAGFRQLGWQIDLSRWDQGGLLARREAAPELTVHVRLER